MKICLVNLPWRKDGRIGVRAGSRWPFTVASTGDVLLEYIPFPFFMAYSAAVLRENLFDVKLIDAVALNLDQETTTNQIISWQPQVLVVETSTPSFFNDIAIVETIKDRSKKIRTILCGPHASTFPVDILKNYEFIDYVLIGEYEMTLLKLVKEAKVSSLPAISYRRGKEIVVNDFVSSIDDINCLPWPYRDSLAIYNYNDGFCGLPKPNVQIMASRGCPYSCSFCLWPQVIYRDKRYRKRAAADVVLEMEYLVKRFNFKAVYFDDDTFNIDKDYVLEIVQAIKNKKITVPWAVMARADCMDFELLKAMKDSGLYAVKYGVESFDEGVLRNCKKSFNIDKALSMIGYTKELGIKIHLTFCLGLPGETVSSVEKTISFIEAIKPDSIQVSVAVPFPGTIWYQDLLKLKPEIMGDWSGFDGGRADLCNYSGYDRNQHEEIVLLLREKGLL